MELTRDRIRRVIRFSHSREDRQLIICSAIRQLRPIEFYYHGGPRTVEPFALGVVLTDHRDNLSLLCFQTGGVSDLLETTGWRLYRVSDMEDLEVMKDHFNPNRSGYEPQNLEMVKIICFVQPVLQPEEEVKLPPREEIKIETSPVIPCPPPPPPPPVQEPFRPIVRVISHNELMSRFRYAHPPTEELTAMLWPEPLVKPFPEPGPAPSPESPVEGYLRCPVQDILETTAKPSSGSLKFKIWPDTPLSGLVQPA